MRQLQAILAEELATPAAPGPVAFSRIKDLSEAGQDKAMELLERLAGMAGDCAAGRAAAGDLAGLMVDKGFYDAYVARREARRAAGFLLLARQLRQAGRLDRALACYRRILREFAQTPAAVPAKTEAAQVEELMAVEQGAAP